MQLDPFERINAQAVGYIIRQLSENDVSDGQAAKSITVTVSRSNRCSRLARDGKSVASAGGRK